MAKKSTKKSLGTKAKRVAATARAKQAPVKASGAKSRVKGHLRVTARRKQGKRDSKNP